MNLLRDTAATDSATADCVITDGRPHRATDGLLCRRHLEQLGNWLHEIEDEALLLSAVPGYSSGFDRGASSTPAFERSPIRPDAAALIDRRRGTGTTRHEFDETGWDDTPSVLEALHAWARQVRVERHLHAPQHTVILAPAPRPAGLHGPVCARLCGHDSCGPWITDTVPAPPALTVERRLLTTHLDWIARQPWVEDMHQELRDVLHALRRANNSADVHVGTCDTLQPNGDTCTGRVWHVLIKPDGRVVRERDGHPDDEPGFRCGTCRRVWTGTDAVRKRDQMWRDEQTRATERKGA